MNLNRRIPEKRNDLHPQIPKWFVVYTAPRHEKIVAKQLLKRNIECYLPLKKELRQWSDRKKWVEVPIFTSYIFVKITTDDYLIVRNLDGVSRFVHFNDERICVQQSEIDLVRRIVESEYDIKATSLDFYIGDEVEIISGTLIGYRGKLVRATNHDCFGVEIPALGCFLSIEIAKSDLQIVPKVAPFTPDTNVV